MKKRTKITITITTVLLFSLILSFLCNSQKIEAHIISAKAEIAEKKALNEEIVKQMSFDDIIKNLNRLQNYQDEAQYALITALNSKIKTTSTDKIINSIKNKNNSDTVRTSIIMQCETNDININKDIFAEIVSDEKESVGLKLFLIGELSTENDKYFNVIENLLQSDNDLLWGKALYEQVYYSPENANLIADRIFKNFDGQITQRHKKALEIKALLAAQAKDDSAYCNLISLCKDTLSVSNYEKNAVTAVADALFAAPSIQTLEYVFSANSPFGAEYKHPIAFENKEIITNILKQPADIENATLLSNILDFTGSVHKADVQEYIAVNSDFFSEHKDLLSIFTAYVNS